MVSISRERRVKSERRLRDVIRAAEITHLEGAWCFRRFRADAPARALATVSDADGWCALVPASADDLERFGLTLTTFSPALENSGFVGWLATTIKQRLGSGVFVICGHNPRRGGIFDYLGYPLEIADDVRALLDDLRATEPDDPLNLDLRLFRVVETSPASAISSETLFEFRERDGVVEASYEGGAIVSGFITGRRHGDHVQTAYSQLHVDGALRTGTGDVRLELLPQGQVRLIEEFAWSDGAQGRNVLEAAATPHGP